MFINARENINLILFSRLNHNFWIQTYSNWGSIYHTCWYMAGTNDNWSVDILVEGGIICEEAEVIAWTIVILDDTEK